MRSTVSNILLMGIVFAIQCLTNLMDIFPTICNTIVNHGGVKCFAEVLERSMGFIDLNEACIKALEKISLENPYAILTSGAVNLCLNMMDFFENTTQKRIINLLMNVSRAPASEQDINEWMLPIVPFLGGLLQSRGDQAQAKIESLSTIVLRISESILRFLGNQPLKLTQGYEKLGQTGILESILHSLQDFCVNDSSIKSSQDHSPTKMQPQSSSLLTPQTVSNYLKILSLCSKSSLSLTSLLLDFNLFSLLETFLPSPQDIMRQHFSIENFPFILETITLLDAMLPDKSEDQRLQLIQACGEQRIAQLSEKLLPRIFNVYENNIQPQIRMKTLQIIDKMLLMFNEELINNFIEPYSFAKFLQSNLRSGNLQSIGICLGLIQRLVKANPKTFTLPIIREGVAIYIKQNLVNQEMIEKKIGIKIGKEESEQDIRAQARELILSKEANQDPIQFEQSLQKYMEISRLARDGNQQKQLQQQVELVVKQAQQLLTEYFDNQAFLTSMANTEDFQALTKLKELAEGLKKASMADTFDFEAQKSLLQQLSQAFSSHIMAFEFKASGLLNALAVYLTHTPDQAKVYYDQNSQIEEIKHSEEIKINNRKKQAQRVAKKQAKAYIERIKVVLHVLISENKGKQPISELVQLCHEVLSQSEYLIFDTSQNQMQQVMPSFDHHIYGGLFAQTSIEVNQSMSALKQLTRRVRVNLVYDPNKTFLKSPQQQPQASEDDLIPMETLQALQKNASHHPAFLQLADNPMEPIKSKVFIKRNFLYKELKQVLISVEQCASVWLLEDFLRTKIRTLEEVKLLKAPQQQLYQKTLTQSVAVRQLLEATLDRLRSNLDNNSSSFDLIVDQTSTALLLLNSVEVTEFLRLLEVHILQLMDDQYASAGLGSNGGEEEELAVEEIEIEQRMYELQRSFDRIKESYREKKATLDTEMQEEAKNEEDKQGAANDVEMTEESEPELQLTTSTQSLLNMQKEIQLSFTASEDQEVLNTDLEDLIKAQGEDIDFEFYYQGTAVSQNQTLFELLRRSKSDLESSSIHFCIKDKNEEVRISRKDSILEFAQKRERTKSEAVEDISTSAIKQMVEQLIDKEFRVFEDDRVKEEKNKEERKELENSLKVLKVLNYLCRHPNLMSSQGLTFLLNDSSLSIQQGFTDLDLQFGLSLLRPNLFHHHKLDAYILKNLQDPYNLIGGSISDTLQQIFKSCPFLFPTQTRMLFFKLVSFIGSIDMNRSLYFLRQYLKSKIGKIPENNEKTKQAKQKVIVDRTKVLESAFSLMKQMNKRAFLEVQYKDEAGTGLGPTLEFYYLVAQELKAKPEIWRKNMIDNSLFPAPIDVPKASNDEVTKIYEIFRLTGMMIAKSIADDKLIDLPMSGVWWDLVLGKKMNIFDLERIDKDLFKTFAEFQLLANQKKEIDKQVFSDPEAKARQLASLRLPSGARVEDLGLGFVLPGTNLELQINGSQTDLNLSNLQDYIDLVLHTLFHESIKIQLQAFKKGFNSIFQVDNLRAFGSGQELEDLICGQSSQSEDWLSVQKLQEHILPAHGYHSKSSQYLSMLQMMTELSIEDRRKFLKFVTGSPRLPSGGFAALEPKMTVVLKKPISVLEKVDDILPSVMTCQNYVKVPAYTSQEIMVQKFKQAFNEGANNFTLS